MRLRSSLALSVLLVATPALAQSAKPKKAAPAQASAAKTSAITAKHPALPILPKLAKNAKALAGYRIPATSFKITLGPEQTLSKHSKRSVSFPSAVKKRWPTISGTYYAPIGASAKNPVPAAVVVHHLGGGFEAEEYLAQHLAVHGVAAMTISLPNYGKRREKNTKQGFLRFDPMTAMGGFKQAVKDVIRAGDALRAMPGVDASRVGVVGVSLGAFVSSVAKGVDPRFRQTVLILGGGDIVGVAETFPEAKSILGAGKGGMLEMLRSLVFEVDPLTYADRIAPGETLMLNAIQDEIVPRRSTDLLHGAIGQPRIRWFDCGHYGIVLHLGTVLNETLDHLKRRAPL